MRKIILITFAMSLLCASSLFSQIIAGSGAPGQIISNPAVTLANHVIGNVASAYLDLNCDSVADMRVDLIKGATAIDGANEGFLYVLNPAFEICADTASSPIRAVNYYNAADTLYCTGTHTFENDTIYQLGNYGCMDCSGPYTVSNMFVAYRNTATSQTGWMKIMMNLIDSGAPGHTITLSIPQVLSPCVNTSLIVPPVLAANDSCGPFHFHYQITPVSCTGSCNGAIHITGLVGGTSPYVYSWAPGSPDHDGPLGIINLCTGNYSITITDANGISCTFNFFVPDAPPINYTLTVVSPGCNGNADGSVCCTGISGGAAPYTFTWSNGNTSSCANGLVAGSYTLCVTDSTGCQICGPVNVSQPAALTAAVTVNNASCSTCCDGSVVLTPSGGTAGYTVSYAPVSPVSGACPGTYSYHITDANGCTHDSTITISFAAGISNIALNSSVSVFPNPSTGNFTIELPAVKTAWLLELTDLQGRVVYQEQSSGTKLILNTATENGVYLLRITNVSTNEQAVKKLVIQK